MFYNSANVLRSYHLELNIDLVRIYQNRNRKDLCLNIRIIFNINYLFISTLYTRNTLEV